MKKALEINIIITDYVMHDSYTNILKKNSNYYDEINRYLSNLTISLYKMLSVK